MSCQGKGKRKEAWFGRSVTGERPVKKNVNVSVRINREGKKGEKVFSKGSWLGSPGRPRLKLWKKEEREHGLAKKKRPPKPGFQFRTGGRERTHPRLAPNQKKKTGSKTRCGSRGRRGPEALSPSGKKNWVDCAGRREVDPRKEKRRGEYLGGGGRRGKTERV